MTLRTIFYTSAHRVRLIWSVFIFLTGFGAGYLSLSFFHLPSAFVTPVLVLWMWLVSWLMIRVVERRPAEALGLHWQIFSAQQCWGGLALGGSLVSFVVLLTLKLGEGEIVFHPTSVATAFSILAIQFVSYVFAAALEELSFRGYPFQIAIERMPVTVAVILFSAWFAGLHAGNPGVTTLGLINTFLAGLWFAGAYLRTRQLWLPIALHAGWNFMQGAVWGADVSGWGTTQHLFATHLTGPQWLTGGAYGPEGGVICTVAVIAGIIAVHRMSMFQISPDQFALMHRIRYMEDHAIVHAAGTNA